MIKSLRINKRVQEARQQVSTRSYTYDGITLHEFIEQLVTEKINPDISAEFFFNVRDFQQNYLAKLVKQLNLLNVRMQTACSIIRMLEIEEQLQTLKPDYVLHNKKELWKVLQSIVPARNGEPLKIIANRLGKLEGDIRATQSELKRLTEENGPGVQVDRKYFTFMIAQVGSFHKMQINRKTLLLCEFVDYYLLMREHYRQVEQQMNKK